MASETDIANLALTDLGSNTITSLTDGSANATVINAVFDEVRDQTLAKHNWNFASERVELAQSDTDPVFGFQHKYAKPADWIKTISVHDTSDGFGTAIYKAVGNYFESDANQLWLYYVKRVEDTNLMTADFRRAFAAALAHKIARKVTDSNTIRMEMKQQSADDVNIAKSKDALEGTPDQRPRGSWVTGRFGSRSNNRW